MGIAEKLEFLLSADPSQAVAGFQRVGDASAKSLAAAESNAAKVGATMAKVGAAGVGVGGLLTMLGSKEEQASNQLKAAVDQAGASYDAFKEKLEASADAQAKYGRTAAEAKDALTKLTLAFNDPAKALDEMQLAEDIAARKGISLSDAAGIIARVHGGATKALKEFGVVVTKNADGSKDMDKALSDLSQKLNGQAAAAADTATGKFKALKAEAENVVAKFGEYGPAILGVSTALTLLGSGVSAVSGLLAKRAAAAELAAAADAELAAATQAAAVAEAEFGIGSAEATAALEAQAVAAEAAAVTSAGFLATLGPLALAVGVAALALKVGSEYWKDWSGGGISATSAVDKAVNRLANSHDLKNFNMDVADTIGALAEGGNGINGFADAASQLFDKTLNTQGKEAATTLLTSMKQLKDEGIIPADTDLAAMAQKITEFSDTTAMDAQKESVKELDQAVKDAQKSYDELLAAQQKILPAALRAQAGPDNVAAAQATLDEKSQALLTAKAGGDPAKIAAASRDYNDALRGAESAANDFAQAQVDLQVTLDASTGKVDTEADKTYLYRDALGTIADSMTGPAHDALEAHIADWDNLTIAADAAHDALVDAGIASADAAGTPLSPEQRARVDQRQRDSGDRIVAGHRATGGPVGPGTWLVGEQGPELMRLGASSYGQVYNANQTAGMMGGGGLNVTQHIYETTSARQTAAETAAELEIMQYLAAA